MKYEHGFQLPLFVLLKFVLFIEKIWNQLFDLFMKKVLRKNEYVRGSKFPYAINDMDLKLRKELEQDFDGLYVITAEKLS